MATTKKTTAVKKEELKFTKKQKELLEMAKEARRTIGQLVRDGKMRPYEKA